MQPTSTTESTMQPTSTTESTIQPTSTTESTIQPTSTTESTIQPTSPTETTQITPWVSGASGLRGPRSGGTRIKILGHHIGDDSLYPAVTQNGDISLWTVLQRLVSVSVSVSPKYHLSHSEHAKREVSYIRLSLHYNTISLP